MTLILGADSNGWNGPIDFQKGREAGARFWGLRSSINITEDAQFARGVELCDLPRFFWHYLSKWNSWEWQAEFFCELIEDVDWQLRPVVDCESFTPPEFILPFCQYIEERLKVRPIIYTEYDWWSHYVGNEPLYAAYDLWACDPRTGITAPWSDGERQILPWDTWKLWQFSIDGNGRGAEFGAQSDDLCLDHFNGDIPALDAEIATVNAERYGLPPPDPLEVRVERLEVGAAEMNERLTSELAELRGDLGRALDAAGGILLGE